MNIKELMRRYKNGTSIQILAELSGVTEVEINYALASVGGTKQRDEQDLSILRYYEQGLTDRKIASIVGCSDSTVWRWRIANDLPAVSKRGKQTTYKGDK